MSVPVIQRWRGARRTGAVLAVVVAIAALLVGASAGPADAVPANDDFANAEVIAGSSGSVTGSTVDATAEVGEPGLSAPNTSIWYSWTAPADERIAFDTCGSDFDTYIGVYTGASLATLTFLAENDDGADCEPLLSRLFLDFQAGTTYHIQVDGYLDEVGNVQLNWAPAVPPPNDDFAGAEVIAGSSGSVTGSTVDSGGEPGEPELSAPVHSIWYSWTAPADERIAFDTCGSAFDTYIGIYTGSAVDALTRLAGNDDHDGADCDPLFSRIALDVRAGTVYAIQVDGYSTDVGALRLNWAAEDPPDDGVVTATPPFTG